MSELDNIFNGHKGRLPEDRLLAYFEGRLSPEEQHEVELWLAEEGMEADALEGLQSLPVSETKEITGRLNHELYKKLDTKKRRRAKPIKENNWAWLAVIIILLLCITAYIVFHYIAAR